jgi:hypothetical protein
LHILKEFAKFHIEKALKSASKVLKVNNDADWVEYPTTERILEPYPLSNIR